MAIYLKLNNVQGTVTTKGYEGWIQLIGMQQQNTRQIVNAIGMQNSRDKSIPQFSHVSITKLMDKSSHKFLQYFCNGSAFDQIDIHCCTTDSTPTAFLKFQLSNVMVATLENIISSDGHPIEAIDLSFSKFTQTYIPRDATNKATSPIAIGYDLQTAQLS